MNVQPICFRDEVPEITDTGYLTHDVYYYPAKFIPQIVRFCINEYTKPNDWVLDPFAGSGTVGLECFINNRNAVLFELSPLLAFIMPIKVYGGATIFPGLMQTILDEIKTNKSDLFEPKWKTIRSWYPPDGVYERLTEMWGGLHKQEPSIYKNIAQASLVKVSKYFSLAEHKQPKLFRSKSKKKIVAKFMESDWRFQMNKMFTDTALKMLVKVNELARTIRTQTKIVTYSGIDSGTFHPTLNHKVQSIISSPPYVQAQEYIRTVKLDLYWLGLSEEEISRVSKLEIPYRKAPEDIRSSATLNKLRGKIERKDLTAVLDSFFYWTIKSFENAASLLEPNGKLLIFTGNPKVDGLEVETWRILMEHFQEVGFNTEKLYEDKIKTRQLFRKRNNKNPDGMKSEFLLVMNKK